VSLKQIRNNEEFLSVLLFTFVDSLVSLVHCRPCCSVVILSYPNWQCVLYAACKWHFNHFSCHTWL